MNESDNITDNRNNEHGKNEAHDTRNITNDKDDEGDEGMTIIHRSARLKKKKDEFRDFIICDIVEKRKSRKERNREAKSHKLVAPFLLDEATVSYRALLGITGISDKVI